jgi:hypothetical protein
MRLDLREHLIKSLLDDVRTVFLQVNQEAWGGLYGSDRLIIEGYEIEKTGIGSDVHAIKKDIKGNVVDDKLVDFKTGDATLSKNQKECGAEKLHVWTPGFTRHFSPPFK